MTANRLIYTDQHLLVYETKEAANEGCRQGAPPTQGSSPGFATTVANHWSKKLNCQVWYSEPGDVFLVLEENKKLGNLLLKVLHGNRVGWIFNYNWLTLKEAKEIHE